MSTVNESTVENAALSWIGDYLAGSEEVWRCMLTIDSCLNGSIDINQT